MIHRYSKWIVKRINASRKGFKEGASESDEQQLEKQLKREKSGSKEGASESAKQELEKTVEESEVRLNRRRERYRARKRAGNIL